MLRRDFMKAMGAGCGVWGAGTAHPRTPHPEPRTRLSSIGVQLYTLRAEMERDVEATLARVAQIGYREVEFAGYFGRAPARLRATLDRNRLRAPSAHFELQDLEGEAGARNITAARIVGHRFLVVAWTPQSWRRTLDDWRRLAERMNEVARRTRAAGIQFCYHNHDFEFRPIDGRIPFDVFCEATDPRLVKIELDLYWITHGGSDPQAFIDRWPGRIPMVHVKDRTADARMVDVGEGVIDWRAIFAKRGRAGMRHYFIEHDEPADPFASVTASYQYLSRLDI